MLWLVASGVVLWRLGGTSLGHWPRRFLWPAVAGIVLIVSDAEQVRVLACVAGLIAINHAPYGDDFTWRHQEFPLPWWLRILILTSLAVPSLLLSWHLWALRLVLMGGLASLFFWLSRRYNRFSHLLFETLCGFLQALTLVVGR